MGRFRYRLKHWKMNPFHLLSQLDLTRMWDRIVRRARLPVAYSQGFNPRPLFSFAPATPLGVESRAEYVDVIFQEEFSPDTLSQMLRPCLPSELRLEEVVPIPLQAPSLAQSVVGVLYSFSFFYPPWEKEDPPFPEGVAVEYIKEEGDILCVCFRFTGKEVLLNPLKFASFLHETHGCCVPFRIVKEEVILNLGG